MEWVYLDVFDKDVIPIAESLINKDLRNEGYKVEENPHVTIVPKFEYEQDIELPELLPNQRFDVSGFKFWPDMEDPMIVMLDVSDDMVIQLWRDEILTQIGKKSVKDKMVPPHITLFKAGNNGDEYDFRLDSKLRNNLLDDCKEIQFPIQVRANGLKIEDWQSGL